MFWLGKSPDLRLAIEEDRTWITCNSNVINININSNSNTNKIVIVMFWLGKSPDLSLGI